jgi:hypothetical protein
MILLKIKKNFVDVHERAGKEEELSTSSDQLSFYG